MRRKWIVLLIALFSTLALAGCGSSGGGGSEVTDGGGDIGDRVETVGTANCLKCHSPNSPETFTWLMSAHANPNESPGRSGPAGPDSQCAPCHNQLQEGQLLPDTFSAPYNVTIDDDTTADVARNIVVCESCHGGGSAHRGIGPIPYARPDWEQCVACHDYEEGVDGDRTAHIENWGKLASSVGASAHNNADDLHASTTRCQRCHTVEGSIQLSAYTGDSNVMHLMDEDQDNVAPVGAEENLHPVTCAACHKPHDDSGRWEEFIINDNSLAQGNWDPNQNGQPDQFDFCTSCHTYYNQDGVLVGSGSAASGTAPFYHNTAWYRTLTTTHYDNPATPAEDVVEGYVIRTNSDNPCFDCHGHELRTNTRNGDQDPDPNDPDVGSTVHTQWASGPHGGRLLPAVRAAADAVECDPNDPETSRGRCPDIVDAAMAAGVTSENGDPWIHYNWDDTADRGSCQECHTATGAMNYLNDPASYDSANNDYSHLANWSAVGGSPQNEVLYCWGCHENPATGVLRNPGPISRPYAVGGVTVTLPDLGNSNVCVNCHGARGNVEEYGLVENPAADMSGLKPGFGPGTKNVTEAHYLVAAATIFAADTRIGYEYAGLDYSPVPFFGHDSVGLNEDAPESGSGPCATCHMEIDEPHLFAVVNKDTDGKITALNSTSCVACHDGGHGPGLVVEDTTTENGLQTAAAAVAFLEAEAEGYHEALAILEAQLAASGVVFTSGYPYFQGSSWINEGVFGAAHNYNYLHHEPGAYAHNRFYAKRILFDSIDWVDNFALDGSISIDAVSYPEAAHWFEAEAGVASRP